MARSKILQAAKSKVCTLRDYAKRKANWGLGTNDAATSPSVVIVDEPRIEIVIAMPVLAADGLVDAETAFLESGNFAHWFEKRRRETRQFTQISLQNSAAVAEISNLERQTALFIAENVRKHIFNFLGSGPFVPVDETRPVRKSGYRPIDWYFDPVRQLRFPQGIPVKDWDLYKMRPANADVKYPWELGRCQHFLALGQAYALSGQASYALELIDQCEDFIEANPVGIGINWTCTMDVGLRAANWCLALPLVLACSEISIDRWKYVYRHLYETGFFISHHLENKYEVTSNHFLSNVIGVHFLASEFCDLSAGKVWDDFARRCLEREIVVQILPDGADYESSVPYHRLVAELFLASGRLADMQGRPLSATYKEILTRMLVFLRAVMRPDGKLPIVGDADDGRVMIASHYGQWDPADGRHILAPAGFALGCPEWIARAGSTGSWEAFWWGYNSSTPSECVDETECSNWFFKDAGIIGARHQGNGSYLLITNSIVGTSGFGNHKHNDQLSFEYHDLDQPLIVDPGSHVYTCEPKSRNAFRSTLRHNTIMVDGVEQNEFNPEWLFRMFAKAHPTHLKFKPVDTGLVYEGSHDGYCEQLDTPVTHQRRFESDLVAGTLNIRDTITGKGVHDLVWNFHFDPAVSPVLAGNTVALSAASKTWNLTWEKGPEAELVPSAVSPSYGVKYDTTALQLIMKVSLVEVFELNFCLRRGSVAP